MIKQFKKEWNEFKNYREHTNYVPENSINPAYNFDEIVKLSNRTNSRFTVEGDYMNFIIRAKSNNILLGIITCFYFLIPVAFVLEQPTNPASWLVVLGVLAAIILYFRYYPSTNNIEINSYNKTIKIKSNNLIGKYIIPPVELSFRDFTYFSFKAKSIRGKGMRTYFNRIYINYGDQKCSFIDLPNGPIYFVNHKAFMNCLTRTIKNDEQNVSC
jgi:hypothetical protein